MLASVCILGLYALQGAIQGIAFGTLPLLLRRNPASTDVHTSQLSIVGYPFSLKFLIAPLVDGLYLPRVGRRESWLLPLQLLTALLLLGLAGRVGPMLDAAPPAVGSLAGWLLLLVTATAAGDVATDAWAAGRLGDGSASVCQAVGLTVGIEGSSTVFFLLLGKGLVTLELLLRVLGTLGLALLGLLALLIRGGGDQGFAAKVPQEEPQGAGLAQVAEVLRRLWRLPGGAANIRWLLAFLVLAPLLSGHRSVLAVRYQAAGFSPELFAEYELYLLPVSIAVMWLGGRVARTGRLLRVLSWVKLLGAVVHLATLWHFRLTRGLAVAATRDTGLKVAYVGLTQVEGALGTLDFVIQVAVFNRVAQRDEATAGSVITLLASVSNLGDILPETWAPLLADAAGVEVTALFCLAAGLAVLAFFWRKLQQLDDLADVGW